MRRFRVACTHCHTTDKVEAITAEVPALTPIGERAQIMRTSPTFGQHQDCSQCHQTKFALNRSAERLFARFQDVLAARRVGDEEGVSACAGVAELTANDDAGVFVARANRALALAKQAGRGMLVGRTAET